MSSSLRPHGLQQARLPYPSLSPSLLKVLFFELVMPSSHLILCHPLLLLPLIFFSIRVFSSESALHIRWPVEGAEYISNKGMNGEQMDIHQLLKESCIHD